MDDLGVKPFCEETVEVQNGLCLDYQGNMSSTFKVALLD